MQIQEITIQGKELPICFNMKALFAFTSASGVPLDGLNDVMNQDPAVLEELFYQGLKEGHRISGMEMTIKKEDVLAVSVSEFQGYTMALEKGLSMPPAKKKQGKNKVIAK